MRPRIGVTSWHRRISGAAAELTLFDPDRVKDETSYEDPYRAPSRRVGFLGSWSATTS